MIILNKRWKNLVPRFWFIWTKWIRSRRIWGRLLWQSSYLLYRSNLKESKFFPIIRQESPLLHSFEFVQCMHPWMQPHNSAKSTLWPCSQIQMVCQEVCPLSTSMGILTNFWFKLSYRLLGNWKEAYKDLSLGCQLDYAVERMSGWKK